MSLSNKVVLISGSTRGIGAAIVRELLTSDVAKIYAGARNPAALPDFGDARVIPIALDVLSDASVDAAATTARDIDVLINNAGAAGFADWSAIPQAAADSDMQTNYYGTLRVIRAFAPHLVARGAGTIANVVSIVGLAPAPPLAGYSASKAALHSLTQSLRGSLAASGVAVLGIYPGPIDTELARDLPLEKVTPEVAATAIVQGISAGTTAIFPDPMARQIEHLWTHDIHHLEAAMRMGG